MTAIEPMICQIIAQTLYREVGVDNAHHHTDGKEQNQDFYGVIDKKIDGSTYVSVGIKSDQLIYSPIGNALYHYRGIKWWERKVSEWGLFDA